VFRSTVEEAQKRLTHREFIEWLAEYELEPWGTLREDARHAIQCQAIAGGHAEDYTPRFEFGTRKTSAAEAQAGFRAYSKHCMAQAGKGAKRKGKQ
jgi:hypothetical protein